MITASSCPTNPAIPNSGKFCPTTLTPGFTGPARINGKWGKGVTLANYTSVSFINSGAFTSPVAYSFGNSPRTAPFNPYGPDNYQLDLAMVRSFPLHITEATKLDFRAEWYNVTNHTFFAVASTAWGNASFGHVGNNSSANRKAAQFSARIDF